MNSLSNALRRLRASKGSIVDQVRSLSRAAASRASVYELRTDVVKPANFDQFAAAMRPPSSGIKSNGLWTTAMGGQNEVVQILEYDSYADVDAKQSLSGPQNDMKGMLVSQESVIMNAFPWHEVAAPQDKGGVYELRCYVAKAGQIPLWAEAFQQGLPERMRYSTPLGIWFSEIGPLNAIVHLWHYESMAHRLDVRNQALGNETWVNTVKATMPFLDNMHSKILHATEYSSWK